PVDQRCQPKVAAEAVQRRTGYIWLTYKPTKNTGNCSLAAARRPDHQQNFMQVESPADDVAEPLSQRINGRLVVRPQLIKKSKPPSRRRCIWIVVEWDCGAIEEHRRMRNQLSRCDIQQSVLHRYHRAGRAVIEPTRLIRIIRQQANGSECFQKIADLVTIGR